MPSMKGLVSNAKKVASTGAKAVVSGASTVASASVKVAHAASPHVQKAASTVVSGASTGAHFVANQATNAYHTASPHVSNAASTAAKGASTGAHFVADQASNAYHVASPHVQSAASTAGHGIVTGAHYVASGASNVAHAASPHLQHAASATVHGLSAGASYVGHGAASGAQSFGGAISSLSVKVNHQSHVSRHYGYARSNYRRGYGGRSYRARGDVYVHTPQTVGTEYYQIDTDKPTGSGKESELLEELISLTNVMYANNQQSMAIIQSALASTQAPMIMTPVVAVQPVVVVAPTPAPAPVVVIQQPTPPPPAPVVVVMSSGPNPKDDQTLSAALRKDFADNEKNFDDKMKKMISALGQPFEFTADYRSLAQEQSGLSEDNRNRLGTGMWRSYVNAFHDFFVRWCGGATGGSGGGSPDAADNRQSFLRQCSTRRVVVRVSDDKREGNVNNYQQLFFEGGALIIQTTPSNWNCNLYEISERALDHAFDDQLLSMGASPGMVDPTACLALPLRTRRDFREHSKHYKAHLDKINAALGSAGGMQPVTFEADYVGLFNEEKLSTDYRYKLGSNLWDGYLRDLAGLFHNWCHGTGPNCPDNRQSFLSACSSRKIIVRVSPDKKEDWNTNYQQLYFENGAFIIQTTPGNFRCNMYELSTKSLDYAFDDQIEAWSLLPSVVDPTACLMLPLRTRRDFRDHQHKLKQHLDKLNKALGGGQANYINFEADYPTLFNDEKLSKDYRYQLGSNLWDGYARDVCHMLDQYCAKDDDNRAAFLASCSARAIVYRTGDRKEEMPSK